LKIHQYYTNTLSADLYNPILFTVTVYGRWFMSNMAVENSSAVFTVEMVKPALYATSESCGTIINFPSALELLVLYGSIRQNKPSFRH